MDVYECMKARRSIRKYLDKPLAWDDVTKIIDGARTAPNAGNIQNWKFIVVLDQAKREKISEACLQQYWMQTAPVHVVICSEPEKAERYYGVRGERLYSVQNCAAAAMNVLLMATSLGLGSCWVGAFDEDMVKRILGIPEEVRPQVIITIGYADEKPANPIRHPLNTTLHMDSWRGFFNEPELIFADYGEHATKRIKEATRDIKRTTKQFADTMKKKFGKKK